MDRVWVPGGKRERSYVNKLFKVSYSAVMNLLRLNDFTKAVIRNHMSRLTCHYAIKTIRQNVAFRVLFGEIAFV